MGRRYYRRSRRSSGNPLLDLAVEIIGAVMIVAIMCYVLAVLSSPNALKFSFGATPTPTIVPNNIGTNIDWSGALAFFAICAIVVSGGGLIILGIIWLAWRFLKQPRVVKTTTSPTMPASPVSQSSPTIPVDVSAPKPDVVRTSLDVKPDVSRSVPINPKETIESKPFIAAPPQAILVYNHDIVRVLP